MNNYTLIDLTHISLYLIVWFIVSIGQGFVIGYVSNALNFRRVAVFRQLGLAAIFSICIIPSLYYLIGLIGGIKLAAGLNLVFLIAAIAIIGLHKQKFQLRLRHLRQESLICRSIIFSHAIWIVVGLALVIDVQINGELYLSMTCIDQAGKTAMADAIGRTGIPPANSMFFPGHSVPLYYCYYWSLLCTVVSTICGSMCNTRDAIFSGMLWTGSVFLCLLSFCCKYFKATTVSSRQVSLFALLLLLVSNLYFAIVLPVNLIYLRLIDYLMVPVISWWTADQTNWLTMEMLWVPHHIAGFSAGILGSILILEINKKTIFRQRLWLIILAGFCVSSNFGLSPYTAIGFGFTWIIWTLLALWQKRIVDCLSTVLVGIIGLLASAPFLLELIHARHVPVPLSFWIRKFEVIDWLIPTLMHTPKFLHQLFYLLVLPLNYLVGFGFMIVGALLFWRQKKNKAEILKRPDQLFLVLLACTGLILGTFVRTTIHNNDFGWKVMFLPSFAFLLWSAQFLALQNKEKGLGKLHWFSQFLIVTGILTSIYALYLDRTSSYFATNQAPSGLRSYAWRKLYEDLNQKISYRAVVQHNPISDFFIIEPYYSYYSHHQAVASDDHHGSLAGPGPAEYKVVADEIKKLFTDIPLQDAIDICRRYKINVLVVKDLDPIWSNKSAWIWKFPVIAANPLACAVQIKAENRSD